MNKNIPKLILFLVLLTIIIIILIPHYTVSPALSEQEKANEAVYQNLLKERLAKKEAAEKIYLTGKFDPAQRKDFTAVPAKYSISGYKMYLRAETLDAFSEMAEAADEDDVDLKIVSATRNFDYQKNLWDDKWEDLLASIPGGLQRFKKILEYSAVPGTSRHHWGTDIDINGATPEYFESEKGESEYSWLVKNASEYGFCQPYNLKDKDRPTGYNEEKWHWSYLPLSRAFTQEYKELITDDDIKGFDGDEFVAGQDLINNYVLGINPDCI